MVAAQAPQQLTLIEQLEKLQADSVSYIKQAMDSRVELQKLMAENEQKQQELKRSLFGETNGVVTAPIVAATPVVKTRGRKPGKVAAPKAAKAAKATKASKSGKNYSNETSLRKTCWNVLSRKPNHSGLNVADLTDVIEKEKLWKSSASDITQMVQQAVYKLRTDGKLDRTEDGLYFVIAGQTL